jgi:hypothetical protein
MSVKINSDLFHTANSNTPKVYGYNFRCKNRYKLFGKQEECMMPKPEWKQKFLS